MEDIVSYPYTSLLESECVPRSCASLSKQYSFHQSSLNSLFAFAVVFPLRHLQSDEVLDNLTNHSKDKKKESVTIYSGIMVFFSLDFITKCQKNGNTLVVFARIIELYISSYSVIEEEPKVT